MPRSARPPFRALVRCVRWALISTLTSAFSCRSKPPGDELPAAKASARPTSSGDAGTAQRCRVVGQAASLLVGDPSRGKRPVEDEEEPELPFAPSIGGAVALPDGFAVSGIFEDAGRPHAFVAFLPLDGKPGRRVSLGAVHGDPDPPLIAPHGDGLSVAVGDSDAAGRTLRLGRLSSKSDALDRVAEITGVASTGGGGLAEGERGTLVVWSPASAKATALRAALLPSGKPASLGVPREIAGTEDAESPVVRARPGGFWLAWMEEQRALDAGAPDPDAPNEETRPLELGPRVVMTALLHADGTLGGAPRPVSDARSHVVAFDAATLPDGALGLAWRENEAIPGVETRAPELARVGPDGVVSRGRAAEAELGAGAPSLVREPAPSARTFVNLPGADDTPRLGVLAADGVSLSPLFGDPSLRGAEVLAAGAGRACGSAACARFVVARSRNRAVELSVVECRPW